MDFTKQIVDNQARNLVREFPDLFSEYADEKHKISAAFLLLGVSAYLNIDIEEAARCLTDGGEDGGFDAAFIDENGNGLAVVLFQAKYTFNLEKNAGFPENALEKAVMTINTIFDPSKGIVLNEKSMSHVNEIHALLNEGRIPRVVFVCLNNGKRWGNKGDAIINRAFSGQSQVSFEYFNCDDIISYGNRKKKINADMRLSGMAIHEDFNYKSVIVGRVAVPEIARLMSEYKESLLQGNIRYFLGKNDVNNAIKNTLLDIDDNSNFFFYNNGITIICEKFSANYLQKENWIVKMDNLQIINGGQTCMTIGNVISENTDCNFSNAYVLVRIYQLDINDAEMIRKITVATNNQNPVDLRDLRANDEQQKLLSIGVKELGYTYKTKRDAVTKSDAAIIPSTVGMEAVLTVWREKPFLAKYHKSEIFSTYYDYILGKDNETLNAAQLIIAVTIFRFCDRERKKITSNTSKNILRKYSSHLMAALLGRMLLEENKWTLEKLTHLNFKLAIDYFEKNCQRMYKNAEDVVLDSINDYFSYMGTKLGGLDGRTLASAFRNEGFCNRCFSVLTQREKEVL